MGANKLFGTNGIRGLTNKELTPEMAVKIGSAIGTFFKRKTCYWDMTLEPAAQCLLRQSPPA